MAAYEIDYLEDGCMFQDHLFLRIDLIKTYSDVEVLTECEVIENHIGVSAFKNWKSLEEGLVKIPSSKAHHDMKEAINRRCRKRRHRYWHEFRILFCSRPWLALSAITVVIVTVATLLQTYVAIIGSNRMKPHYP